MLISNNALNMLTASEYRSIGKAWINKNLRGGESEAEIVAKISKHDESATAADFERRKNGIRAEIELLGDAVDGVIGVGDENFPMISGNVKEADRPIALFYKGDISLIKKPAGNVAVIGLLAPSEQIKDDECLVVRKLVAQNMCIVSGLALGCDTIGHRETLDCGGKTVAFLSSPLTQVNPPSNRSLAEEIVEKGGLLVTEYFRDVTSKREFIGRYAERDRLQAMFASAVILAASYSEVDSKWDRKKDSGSRFAMRKAAEYGVARYVIYDEKRDALNPMYNLSREEIAKGAKIISSGDVLNIARREQKSQMELGF